MNFIKEEHLFEGNGVCISNGKRYYKLADILIISDKKYYHIVFVKISNFYTLLIDDFKTYPTFDLLKEVLSKMLNIDFGKLPTGEEIDRMVLSELYDNLTPVNKSYKIKNYILKISDELPTQKKKAFFLNHNIPVSSGKIIFTGFDVVAEVYISQIYCDNTFKYDRLFSLSADNEIIVREMICLSSNNYKSGFIMDFITEKSYYLKKQLMEGAFSSNNINWSLQVIEYNINKGRDIPIEILIEGDKLSNAPKRFFIIFPISGIKIKNDIRFGLITFSNESGVDPERQEKMQRSTNKQIDCYAQIAVNDESLLKAVNSAIAFLNKTINLLKIILMDDTPMSMYGLKDNFNCWDYSIIQSNLQVNNHFYVEDVINSCNYAILSTENKKAPYSAEINSVFEHLLNDNNFLENYFYSESTKEKEDLLQSISWLNISYIKSDKNERIISLYNSIEFLVTGINGEKLETELEYSYGDEYKKFADSLEQLCNNIDSVKLKSRIEGIMNNALRGNSSLESKLRELINTLNISFEDYEWKLFKKLKNNRHKLIHNKKNNDKITHQELNELYHIISKVIIYKINLLCKGEQND